MTDADVGKPPTSMRTGRDIAGCRESLNFELSTCQTNQFPKNNNHLQCYCPALCIRRHWTRARHGAGLQKAVAV